MAVSRIGFHATMKLASALSCLSDGLFPEEIVEVLRGGTGFLQVVSDPLINERAHS